MTEIGRKIVVYRQARAQYFNSARVMIDQNKMIAPGSSELQKATSAKIGQQQVPSKNRNLMLYIKEDARLLVVPDLSDYD